MIAEKPFTADAVALPALTARELMTPNPLSLRDDLTFREAIAFLVRGEQIVLVQPQPAIGERK